MTTKKKIFYWIAGILAVAGIAAVPLLLSLDVDAFLTATAGNVGVIGLIGVLYQLLRDEAAHQKVVLLQHDDQSFQVGATSHMANLVFDRHVVFCQEYVDEVQSTIDTLVREHASASAMNHANKLQDIRRKHATWVTVAMSQQLMQFEDAVRKVGAKARFVAATTNTPDYAEQRLKAIDEMFAGFEELLPELFQRTQTEGISAASIVQRVRCMLAIEELVEMRGHLVSRAYKAVKAATS